MTDPKAQAVQNYIEKKILEGMVPDDIKKSMFLYYMHGADPGNFLTAVLCNDLREAFGRADSANRAILHDIVKYVHWQLPSICCGSHEKVAAWMKQDGARQ